MAFHNVVPGNNWNYTYSDYTPYILPIVGVTNASQATIDYGTVHPYSTGEYLSFRVSKPYGMVELNNLRGKVLSLTSTTVTVDINSNNFNTFIYPPIGEVIVPAVSVPAGSGVIPGSNPSTVNLEDSFDNQPLN